jgi:hypothetical protein
MGLTLPVSNNDVYNWSTDAQNLALESAHDHSPGRGARLTGASITPNSLSGIHIANKLQAINPSQVGIQVGTTTVSVPAVSSTSPFTYNVTYPTAYAAGTTVIPFVTLGSSGPSIPSSSSVQNIWPTSATVTGFTINVSVTAGTLFTHLTTALTLGTPTTTLAVAAIPTSLSNGEVLELVNGANTQLVTTSATASSSATSISVVSFTPNFSYPITTTNVQPSASITFNWMAVPNA